MKINILITAYNQEKYIEQCVRSALRQDYGELSVIVSDNCSTDRTPDLLKPFMSDKRFVYSRTPENIGMNRNFRRMLYDLADGEYALFLPGDDYLIDPTFIREAAALIRKNPGLPMVFADYQALYEKDNSFVSNRSDAAGTGIIPGKELFLNQEKKYRPILNAVVFNVGTARRIRFMQPEFVFVGSDVAFCLMMALQGNAGYIRSEVVVWRRQVQSISIMFSPDETLEGFAAFEMPFSHARQLRTFPADLLDRWREERLKKVIKSQWMRYCLLDLKMAVEFKEKVETYDARLYALLKKDPAATAIYYLARFKVYWLIRFIMKFVFRNEFLYIHYRNLRKDRAKRLKAG